MIGTSFSVGPEFLRFAQDRLSPASFGAEDSAATVRVVAIICKPQ